MVWAVITARAGSKRVPDKNLRLVGDRPLLVWTLDAAVSSEAFERVLVSSDSEAIRALSSSFGVPPLPLRPSHLASDTASSHSVVTSILETERANGQPLPDAVCLLQPTSPFRTSDHMRSAIEVFSAHQAADSLVSCQVVPAQWLPQHQAVANDSGFLESPTMGPIIHPSVEAKRTHLVRNGAIYMTRVPQVFDYLVGGQVLPYVMDEVASIDINTEVDLAVADLIARSPAIPAWRPTS
jgi:CMP-N,N'-diacetyllegionaminic acid synthase